LSFRGRETLRFSQLPATEQALNKMSIKPVYDIASGTKLHWYPFEIQKSSKTFTYSSSTVLGKKTTLDGLTNEAYQLTDDIPAKVEKQDTVGGYSFGDDTDLETILYIKPNSAFEITQCFIQAAFAMNISAWTDNGVTFDNVEFEIRLYNGTQATKYNVIANGKQATGHNQLAATGTDVYIFQAQFSGESIIPSDTIGIYLKCNNTQVATNTFQSMLLPFFSFTETDYTKTWYQSGMMSHALPSFNAAAAAFKHELHGWPIDTFGAVAS